MGDTDNGPLGGDVGQLPAPSPVPLTVTGVLDDPSETVIVAPPAKVEEGLTRRTVSTLPEIVALTAPLFEAAL